MKACVRGSHKANQNIRLFCGCLNCNRKNFVSGFTFHFHSIVLKDTGNCNENDLKFCSIIWYRNQSIDFQPTLLIPPVFLMPYAFNTFYSCKIKLWAAKQDWWYCKNAVISYFATSPVLLLSWPSEPAQVSGAAPAPRVVHLWWAATPLPCNQCCLRGRLRTTWSDKYQDGAWVTPDHCQCCCSAVWLT